MKPLDPSYYEAYRQLPVALRTDFKPTDSGFVRSTAIADSESAWNDALQEHNRRELEHIHKELARDYMGRLSMYRGEDPSVRPLNGESRQLFAATARETEATLQRLPDHMESIAWIIAHPPLEGIVDRQYVDDVVGFLEGHTDVSAEAAAAELASFRSRADKDLRSRNLRAEFYSLYSSGAR